MGSIPQTFLQRGGLRLLLRLAVSVILCAITLGCRTTNNPAAADASSEGTAAVIIRGNTPGQITAVANQVFIENGYIPASKRPGNLVFEKQGSKWTNLAYGNWAGDVPMWIRVKLAIVQIGETDYALQCRAFHVRDKGTTVEEELKILKLNSGPYQKLLKEIAARFKASAPVAAGTATKS